MVAGIVYIDGELYKPEDAKVSVFDHGLLYGDGVFEGIRFYNSRIFKLAEHVDRMFSSASMIGLTIPLSKEEFSSAILTTTGKSGLKDGYLRPLVTRGIGDLGLDPRKSKKPSVVIICSTISLYGNKHETGISAIIATVRRTPPSSINPNVKSLNYLNNILAKSEANARGADEAIFLDQEGFVAEASADNIFAVKGGVVYTPPTTTNLVGITRATIMDLAKGHYETKVERFKTDFLLKADEVFITGTGGEVAPVVDIDGHKIAQGLPGPVTKDLQKRYFELVRSTGVPIPY
ncbi:MAG: branched-chain-amino-acid transaminase [Candidatus Thermoplasmatota archaeon]|jgi:branched-chain amino acid aminotransferase|nr:branched-chain-amino-acid transaminase [Candidatus Thermoplasmatota archaeon]MCL5984200.1 branched-chain-amino-acid transaminase [Candidatus Thermoplasmatota archaeon]